MKAVLALLALLVVSSGYFVNEAFAEISENQAFLLEGSGFAVALRVVDNGVSAPYSLKGFQLEFDVAARR